MEFVVVGVVGDVAGDFDVVGDDIVVEFVVVGDVSGHFVVVGDDIVVEFVVLAGCVVSISSS